MDFTFSELFLIVLTTSFIIFSLAIKTESLKRNYNFQSSFDELKKWINKLSSKNKVLKQRKEQYVELVESHRSLLMFCLNKINDYIYHTFYLIFLISIISLFLSLIFEMNLLGLRDISKIVFPNLIIHISTIVLLFYIARALFLLICYTKIDLDYINKLANKIENALTYNLPEDSINFRFIPLFKMILLTLFFFAFMIFSKEFKSFFYKYYSF